MITMAVRLAKSSPLSVTLNPYQNPATLHGCGILFSMGASFKNTRCSCRREVESLGICVFKIVDGGMTRKMIYVE